MLILDNLAFIDHSWYREKTCLSIFQKAFQESRKGGSSLGNKISHEIKQWRKLNNHGVRMLPGEEERARKRARYKAAFPTEKIAQKTGIRNIFNRIMTFVSEFLAKT